MRYAEERRMTEAVEHQTSRVTDADDGHACVPKRLLVRIILQEKGTTACRHGHILQKKGGTYGMVEIFSWFGRKDSFSFDFFEFRDQ